MLNIVMRIGKANIGFLFSMFLHRKIPNQEMVYRLVETIEVVMEWISSREEHLTLLGLEPKVSSEANWILRFNNLRKSVYSKKAKKWKMIVQINCSTWSKVNRLDQIMVRPRISQKYTKTEIII